jgi:cell division protein FtsB
MGLKAKMFLSAAVVFLVLLCFLIIFGDNGLRELLYLKQQQDHLLEKNGAIIRENLALYRKVERLQTDLYYIERVARKELGVIGKDEIVLKLNE